MTIALETNRTSRYECIFVSLCMFWGLLVHWKRGGRGKTNETTTSREQMGCWWIERNLIGAGGTDHEPRCFQMIWWWPACSAPSPSRLWISHLVKAECLPTKMCVCLPHWICFHWWISSQTFLYHWWGGCSSNEFSYSPLPSEMGDAIDILILRCYSCSIQSFKTII